MNFAFWDHTLYRSTDIQLIYKVNSSEYVWKQNASAFHSAVSLQGQILMNQSEPTIGYEFTLSHYKEKTDQLYVNWSCCSMFYVADNTESFNYYSGKHRNNSAAEYIFILETHQGHREVN